MGTAYTSSTPGAWNVATNWTPNGIPVSGDTATIASGFPITIPDSYPAVIGNSPAAAGVVLTCNDSLTVGSAVGASLQVKGSATLSHGLAITLSAGSTLFFDGDGNHGQQYTLTCSYLSRIICNGSSGAHVTIKGGTAATVAGGATPSIITNDATSGPHIEATFTDISYLGDASNAGLVSNFNLNYGGAASDWVFALTDCTLDHCGQFTAGSNNACDGSTYSLTRVVSTNTQGTYSFQFQPNANRTGGTYAVTNCRIDMTLLLVTTDRWVATGNVFGLGYYAQGVTPWTTFDNNTVIVNHTIDQLNGIVGDFSNNFLYFNDPSFVNGHMTVIPNAVTASAINVLNNVAYSNSTDNNTRGLLTGDSANACAVTVHGNIFLPNGAGLGSSDFISILNNATNIGLTIEHNTACVEGRTALPIEGVTVADASRFTSLKSNLFWGTSGDPAGSGAANLIAFETDAGGRATANVIPAAVIGYNGKAKLNGTSTTAVTNQSASYAVNFSSPFTPTGDVVVPSLTFKNASANSASFNALAAWDLSLGGPGTETSARNGLIAGTANYTTAAFLAFARDAYRPTTATLHTSYPGDPATADAAGNLYGGTPTMGAMAFLGRGFRRINLEGGMSTLTGGV